MNTIETLNWGVELMSAHSVENPRKNCEIILSYLLKTKNTSLYVDNLPLDRQTLIKFKRLSLGRAKGAPLQYLLGSVEFMGFNFCVDRSALIPRPETELLVEKVIELIDKEYIGKKPSLLDIGTGCGNIAISLTKLRNFSKIIASDVSRKALKVAKKNAKLNKRDTSLEFYNSYIYNKLGRFKNSFDFIVSNPPYISRNDYKFLPKEVKREPKISLYGGREGVDYYKLIVKDSPKFIKESGGYLILEIGYNQKDSVGILLEGIASHYKVFKDYAGFDRIIVARINSKS